MHSGKHSLAGAGMAQWSQRPSRDQKVAGSNPGRRGGRFLSLSLPLSLSLSPVSTFSADS